MRALDRILKGRGGSQLLPLVALIRGMFRNGEQGVWYDPSDLTTLFQDSAGTTPVTAVEQPVGLMLDKSKGLVLGPELVTNGDGSTLTGWSNTPSSWWTVSGSRFYHASSENYNELSQTFTKQGSLLVTFDYEVISAANTAQFFYTNGAGVVKSFDSSGVPRLPSGKGTYRYVITDGIQKIGFSRYIAAEFYIDNISVKELPGNHAFQSTSASRPVLSARVNLLTKTEDFADAVWAVASAASASTPTKGTTTGTRPDGTVGVINTITYPAVGATQASFVYQNAGASLVNIAITESIYVRVASGSATVFLNVEDVGAAPSGGNFIAGTAKTVTTEWTQISLSGTRTSSSSNAIFVLGFDARANAAQTNAAPVTIQVSGADLRVSNDGVGIPAYQRVNTSTNYDTAGFPLYLKTDGVDDLMQTNSINFTSTDKMTVWAGVRKLVSNVNSVFLELSTDVANAGTFAIFPTLSGGGDKLYLAQNKGSVVQGNTGNITNPSSFLLTQIIDFAQETLDGELAARINGTPTVLTYSGSASGTRNFGNYPLYLFRRAGTSLPFNGRMYGLIVRAAQSTGTQISNGEKYINSKTKAF